MCAVANSLKSRSYMQDRVGDLKQAVASKNTALAEVLPLRSAAIFESRRNDRTDIGIFEAQLGRAETIEVSRRV